MVIGSISALFIISLVEQLSLTPVQNNPNLDVGANRMYTNFIAFSGLLTVADVLLLWRCYHIWGMSKRVITMPILFLLLEIILFIIGTVTLDAFWLMISLYSSFVATVTVSTLIAYRIHKVSKITCQNSGRRYAYILRVLLESSFLYAVALLAYAISTSMRIAYEADTSICCTGIGQNQFPLSQDVVCTSSEYIFYVERFTTFIAAASPTILVARIAASSTDRTDAYFITNTSIIPTDYSRNMGSGAMPVVEQPVLDISPSNISEVVS
uniref:Uncharacterized protein n=1 Tax=Psilocybe cubensis TaxID=181762 RepID=A0A8H7XNK9_PSICU